MLLLPMRLPIALPMRIAPHGSQIEPRLCPGFRPTHPGWFHAIFHQMPTGARNDPYTNRPALGQVPIVAHIRPVAPVIADCMPDGLPLGGRLAGIARLFFQSGADGICLPGHDRLRGAPIRRDGRETGHDGFLLLPSLVPLAQAHRGSCGRRLRQGDPCAVGLDHQHRGV
jgi:hypothetical protein